MPQCWLSPAPLNCESRDVDDSTGDDWCDCAGLKSQSWSGLQENPQNFKLHTWRGDVPWRAMACLAALKSLLKAVEHLLRDFWARESVSLKLFILGGESRRHVGLGRS